MKFKILLMAIILAGLVYMPAVAEDDLKYDMMPGTFLTFHLKQSETNIVYYAGPHPNKVKLISYTNLIYIVQTLSSAVSNLNATVIIQNDVGSENIIEFINLLSEYSLHVYRVSLVSNKLKNKWGDPVTVELYGKDQ